MTFQDLYSNCNILTKKDQTSFKNISLIEEKNTKIINNIGGDNITFNIVFNDYKDTDLSGIKNNSEFIKKCIENPINSVRYYLDQVHYNKEIPENKNIKLTNLQSPFMNVFVKV